ncbi:putative uncharacterized protein encoded by LINC00313 [Chlorocebus sabaeus]|uniref:putative uncharacterized protein encoded by LINC00313 n=1 Tax=Chlorocebus sabaeus TaxID=60711 RepID=UPI003BF958E3
MTALSKSKQPSAAGNLGEQTPGECFCRSCFVTSREVWKRWKHLDPACELSYIMSANIKNLTR